MIIYIPVEIGIESLLSFRRLYRLSISSGDSKSISFDDFFLTRPDRDTPVTSKSKMCRTIIIRLHHPPLYLSINVQEKQHEVKHLE